jgi:hypothetical protein
MRVGGSAGAHHGLVGEADTNKAGTGSVSADPSTGMLATAAKGCVKAREFRPRRV